MQAKTGVSTTTYLYGVNPIGEFGSQSVYYLLDGAGSVRQLADTTGFVVLSRWYEPFGQILAQKGTAVATYGYMGAQLDRVTGLLYVNGRYYDPVTGRFLTPSGGGQNPYVPLQVSGALLGPLAILSAMAQRNRKQRKWLQFLAVALLLLAAGGMLVGCGGDTGPPPPTEPPEETPAKPSPRKPTPPSTPTPPPPSRTPLPLPSPCPPPLTPTSGPTQTPSPTPGHPPYTADELNIAARIISKEVGVEPYIRGPEDKVREASEYVAWTMRNRIEVGEELQGPYGTFYRKEKCYTDTFQYYVPYTTGTMPAVPDPLVLEVTRSVFDAPTRTGDPLDGAIFFVNRDEWKKSGRTDFVQMVAWTPVLYLTPTPGPGTPEAPPICGLYFYRKP